jgi:O-antigen ligase/tetratricopeptide (TPR) repeat protein
MMRIRIADWLTLAIEGLVALLVLGSVWPFGSVQAFFQMILLGGVGVVLVLWALKAAVLGQPVWKPCLLVTLVAAFCFLPILQVTPMSPSWIASLSPGTAEWLREFRPPPADLPGSPAAAQVSAETLSFDAGATLEWLFRLIGFAALFAAVRNNLTSPAAAVRFAWMCLANAALLAIVGIGQMTSSSENTVFWRIPVDGSVFGPFICRNHAAYVLNLAIGLAFGLLLGTRGLMMVGESPEERRKRSEGLETREASRGESGRRRRRRRRSERPIWAEMIRDPKVAWLLCGIGICIAGLVATLSRGGAISLLVAGIIGLVSLGGAGARRLRWIIVVPVVAVAFALLTASGFDRVTKRWDKLVDDSVTAESRLVVWSRTAPLIGKFPVFGSGWGTFIEVEPSTRKPGEQYQMAHDFAHNDFLQLWIEGGTLQLAVTVLLLVVLFRQGFRAVDRHRNTAVGRLALGALVGLAAVVFHSFVDFGLHIPSVAVLTATVAAFLANLADWDPAAGRKELVDDETEAAEVEKKLEPRPFAMALQVAGLLGVAGYLVLIGYRQHQAERYRIAAFVAPVQRTIPYLQTAVDFGPKAADARIQLAAAYMDRASLHLAGADAWRGMEGILAGLTSGNGLPAVLGAAGTIRPSRAADDRDFRDACEQIAVACRLAPLSFDAQERLRRAQAVAGKKDAARRTVDRLLRISPSEPEPWFLAGKAALEEGNEPEAIRDWRNCIRANPRFLPSILAATNDRLIDDPKLRNELFALDPALLKRGADIAFDAGLFDLERPLLEDAATILSREQNRTPEREWMLGEVSKKLGRRDEAIKAMRIAWEARREQTDWGAKFAEQLSDGGDAAELKEALIVVRIVRSKMPNPQSLDPLFDAIIKKKAQGELER